MIPEQGWQCPLCKRIYSPRQEMCLYCGGERKKISDITKTDPYPFDLSITTTPCINKISSNDLDLELETNEIKNSPYYTTTTGVISLDTPAPNAVLKEYKENTNATTM